MSKVKKIKKVINKIKNSLLFCVSVQSLCDTLAHTHIFERQIELTFHKLNNSVILDSKVSIKQFRTIHNSVSNYVRYISVFIFLNFFFIELRNFIKITL